MDFSFDFTFNLISTLSFMLALGVITSIAFRIYKKQVVKPKIWKIFIVTFVGLFSFAIEWNMFHTMFRFPLLPLGVWILYFFLNGKGERWQTYRLFAWLGFWANFIFLLSTLLAMPIHQVIYPKGEPTTYIATIDHSSIINIHPSAKEQILNKDSLLKQLPTMRQETINSAQWYQDIYLNTESNITSERFPYQLIGTSSKWGSGLHTIIFIENDGKGILISTPKEQLYIRSEDSLLKEME